MTGTFELMRMTSNDDIGARLHQLRGDRALIAGRAVRAFRPPMQKHNEGVARRTRRRTAANRRSMSLAEAIPGCASVALQVAMKGVSITCDALMIAIRCPCTVVRKGA